MINDAAIEGRVRAEGRSVLETENPQRLREFRATVLKKMCKFWDDTKDIKIAVTETLSHFTRREELIGWVRATAQSDLPAIADEIARLSKENAQLRNQLMTGGEDKINGPTFLDFKAILDSKNVTTFLIEKAKALTRGYGVKADNVESQRAFEELSLHGLIAPNPGKAEAFQITESGRAFVNKYEALTLASKKAS